MQILHQKKKIVAQIFTEKYLLSLSYTVFKLHTL